MSRRDRPVKAEPPAWTRELDCRGQLCPQPVIELGRAISSVEVGERIAVVATDVAARYDIPAWCRMREQEYVGEEVAPDGVPRYVVRRIR